MGSYDLVIHVLSFSLVFAFLSAEPPRLNKGGLFNVSAIEGTFQVFTCSINSGTLPVKFTYFLNGNPIAEDSSGDLTVEFTRVLPTIALAATVPLGV